MKNFLMIIVILIAYIQAATAQPKPQGDYGKDTVWTNRIADQTEGFYMVKFSNTDSLIVAHGLSQDLFLDAKTGREIKRIDGINEVLFINNDLNFIRLNQSHNKYEIFDTKTFQVIDSLESDGKILGNAKVSKDENYLVSVNAGTGFRVWDLKTKKILRTKNLYKSEANLTKFDLAISAITCNNIGILVSIMKTYLISSSPPQYLEKYIQCIYDFNTLDSINAFEDKFRSILSNNCSLIAFAGLDPNYGVEVYDYNKKQQLWQLPINGPSITGIEFSPDDKYLVKSPGLEIWSMETGLNLYIYQSGSSDNFDISHNGKYIISSVGSYLFLWYARFGINPVHDSPDSVKQIIYPNPTTGKATIQFAQPFPEITDIILTDINGNQIQNLFNKFLNSGNQILDFDISRFTIGTYFIRVQNSHLSLIFKLIITK